jgi:uncharacterized protein YggE
LEVKHVNDQATITLSVEEVDKDKALAASRVNQKMKQGLEIVKKADPQASLQTQGYYTYPVYPEEVAPPPGQPRKQRVPTAWRVGQSLQVVTTSLGTLPKTVAAARSILSLNNLHFGLTPETTRLLDDQRIAATYLNLNERVQSIARAMGRKVGDAVLDTVDFEGSGNYTERVSIAGSRVMAMARRRRCAGSGRTKFRAGRNHTDHAHGRQGTLQMIHCWTPRASNVSSCANSAPNCALAVRQ